MTCLAEDKTDGGTQRILLAAGVQQSGPRVARKDDDIGRVLVSNEQPLITGIEGKMPRRCATAVHVLHYFEGSITIADGVNRHAVVTSIGSVEEAAGSVDRHLGGGVRSVKTFGQGGDVLQPLQCAMLRIPCQGIDGVRDFIERIRPLAAGMKRKTSGSGTGKRFVEGRIVRC